MDRAKQTEIVTELLTRLRCDICARIAKGDIPEEWDGIELRSYVADKAAEFIIKGTMDRRRLREYRNTVLVRNL